MKTFDQIREEADRIFAKIGEGYASAAQRKAIWGA